MKVRGHAPNVEYRDGERIVRVYSVFKETSHLLLDVDLSSSIHIWVRRSFTSF